MLSKLKEFKGKEVELRLALEELNLKTTNLNKEFKFLKEELQQANDDKARG